MAQTRGRRNAQAAANLSPPLSLGLPVLLLPLVSRSLPVPALSGPVRSHITRNASLSEPPSRLDFLTVVVLPSPQFDTGPPLYANYARYEPLLGANFAARTTGNCSSLSACASSTLHICGPYPPTVSTNTSYSFCTRLVPPTGSTFLPLNAHFSLPMAQISH
jgi:hypothetical protein